MGKLKSRILRQLCTIKNFLVRIADVKRSLLCFSLACLSSVLLMFAGATNDGTNGYRCASYFADIVQEHAEIDNLALIVEQQGKDPMPDTATELRGLYGAFGNRETNYAGTINAAKKETIKFVDYPIETNLSFVYIQTGTQVSKSKANEKHYRGEFYPLDLMFDFYTNDPTKFFSFGYLSTGQARKIINHNHPGMFDENIPLSELSDDPSFIQICHDEILGYGIKLSFNEEEKLYQITNIFYEEDYFYDTLHNSIGDFMVGYNQYPEGFNKQATYFLNEHEYQNEFYLKYIKSKYGDGDYSFDVQNISYNKEIDESIVFSFLKKTNNIFSIFLTILSIAPLVAAAFLFVEHKLFNATFGIYFVVSFLIPYFIGKIVWIITKNIVFFSPHFTNCALIYLIVIVVGFIILLTLQHSSRKVSTYAEITGEN